MDDMFELILAEQKKQEIMRITNCNEYTRRFGLSLLESEAAELMEYRGVTLKEMRRVEMGESILPGIIYAFCDSSYINQTNYLETITRLQNIFFLYKNESMDELTDSELLEFMRKEFDEICFGDLDYLEDTCLERFTRAVRSGYVCKSQKRLRDEYSLRNTDNEYDSFSEEVRWDYEVYKMMMEDMY